MASRILAVFVVLYYINLLSAVDFIKKNYFISFLIHSFFLILQASTHDRRINVYEAMSRPKSVEDQEEGQR